MISLQEMSMLSILYNQSHRYYHNINHIMDCLGELELVSFINSNQRDIIETAVWYHDAIYNPYSSLNEENSLKLFQVGIGYDTNKNILVESAILATKYHLEYQPLNKPLTTEVMLDIDLSGFGKDWITCRAHADNIRKEYYRTNDTDFYTGRLNFLETINQRESLYYTDFFKNKYHEQSKINIKIEIENTKSILSDLMYNRF